GIYVNRAGRAQAFTRACPPGRSVEEMIERETFPRTPRLTPPDGSARPAWWALEQLRERALGAPPARGLAELRSALERSRALWTGGVEWPARAGQGAAVKATAAAEEVARA